MLLRVELHLRTYEELIKSASKAVDDWWRTHLASRARHDLQPRQTLIIATMGYRVHMKNKGFCPLQMIFFLSFLSHPHSISSQMGPPLIFPTTDSSVIPLKRSVLWLRNFRPPNCRLIQRICGIDLPILRWFFILDQLLGYLRILKNLIDLY